MEERRSRPLLLRKVRHDLVEVVSGRSIVATTEETTASWFRFAESSLPITSPFF
jgi:hypothetical protein